MKRTVLIALVAAMVAIAGCGATTQGSLPSDSAEGSATFLEPTSGSIDGDAGTVNFYVSDEPAAIEDFEHLNVTIEAVGLQKQGVEDEDERDDADDIVTEETDTENETEDTDSLASTTEEDDLDEDETEDNDSEITETEDNESEVNETEDNDSETTETEENETEENEPDVDAADGEEADNETAERDEVTDKDESEGWVTYEVDDRTVDLTELKGENAKRLADLRAPNGTYTAVFVYVSDVEGVLKNGETVNVKLPSEKLQLHTTFEVGANTSTDFVYDIAVHKAGNSGKYILKPNIAESGTDMEIRDIDKDDDERDEEAEMNENGEEMEGDDEEMEESEEMEEGEEMEESEEMEDESESEENETEDSESDEETELELSIELEGNVSAGETVTVYVTDGEGAAESGVEVMVNEEMAGATNDDGRLEITVPEDVEELEIEVTKAGSEAEIERELEE